MPRSPVRCPRPGMPAGARLSCSAAAPSRSTADRRATRDTFLRDARRVPCRTPACPGRAVVDAAHPSRALRPSRDGCRARACICWSATTSAFGALQRRVASASCSGSAAHDAAAAVSAWRAATADRGSPRVSCDQDIAADGFFSLGMIAEFDASLDEYRPVVLSASVLGIRASSARCSISRPKRGRRATGIGCFYDDPVHDVLGLDGHAFQSLYHFTVGVPVEDARLTTSPGMLGMGTPRSDRQCTRPVRRTQA